MRWGVALFVCSTILACTPAALAQEPSLLEQFTVTDTSRLRALATLGRITKSSLLVEAGDMRFLEESVTLSEHQKSFDELVRAILPGNENYVVRRRGTLKIIHPVAPRKPLNRILTLQLGSFSFKSKTVSTLSPNLAFRIREVTGCNPQGFAYAGPPMDTGIPDFDLPSATFEEIIEQTAKAPTPTMWIVLPDSGERGCISDPGSLWQVGIYNDNAQFPFAFREASGPTLVR
jgi:hypothetical protein